MDPAAWSHPQAAHPAHDGSGGMHADDDFQQFLDLNTMGGLGDGMQFDFDFQHQTGAHLLPAAHRDALDTPMGGTDGVLSSTTMQSRMPSITAGSAHPSIPATMMPPPTPTEAISEIDAQIQFLQQQKIQQQQRQIEQQQVAFFSQQQSRMVPPTPQSLDLQAGNRQFYAQPQQTPQPHELFEGFQRLKDAQDMSFTPLVSPAVTPLESQFPMDQAFAVPSAYFSPLTSPALHAQSDPMAAFDRGLSGTTTSSPECMDLEGMPSSQTAPSTGDLAKKTRKTSTVKARSKVSVGKSPITKPQRKKTASTPLMNAQALSDLAETVEAPSQVSMPARRTEPSNHASNSSTNAITDSENGSVSPETLSDMPPPPLPPPRSAKPSPCLAPQNHATPKPGAVQSHLAGKPSPATPASLMKLPSPANKPETAAGPDPMAADNIDNFELPEAVSSATSNQATCTPLMPQSQLPQVRSPASESTSSKTPGFQPLPSPGFARARATASASQSPQLGPNSSTTTTTTTTPTARTTPQLGPRGAKKRASISSSHVSPALLPRISPNIKPLLPGGATAEDTASRLLASKSNYQNILEGNLVPGVSYPSELSTNLTSKRTSHKIAEQGRRNRINSALQEIATLLPKGVLAAESKDSGGESSDKKDAKNSGSGPNSKASTVEMAIEYIKQLQQEVADANQRAEAAEKKLREKEAAGKDEVPEP